MSSKPKSSAAVKAPATDVPSDDRRHITVVRTVRQCGKSAALVNGAIKFTSAGTVIEGTARTVHVPTAESLGAVLAGLTSFDYAIPDYVPAMLSVESFEIVTRAVYLNLFPGGDGAPRQLNGKWFVSLTKAEGVWKFGSWRVLDRDVDDQTPTQFRVPYDQWLELAAQLIPELLEAPRVMLPSSKGRVAAKGVPPVETLNCHTWVLCDGAEMTNDLRGMLRVQADELGLSWRAPRHGKKTGEELPGKGMHKTVFDTAVFTIHRQIYAGAPSVGKGLKLKPPSLTIVAGISPADLTKVPPLTDKSVARYGKRNGVEAKRKGNTLSVTDSTEMTLVHQIELEDGRTLTVAEFLRDTKSAVDEKHRCQCMFRASDSMNGIVRKFPDGRVMHFDNGTDTVYWLAEVDWQLICERFNASADKAKAIKTLGADLTRLDDATYAYLKPQIKALLGMPNVSAMDAARRDAAKGNAAMKSSVDEAFDEVMAEIENENARRNSPPEDITQMRDGKNILAELNAHWYLLFGSNSSNAVTFASERSPSGQQLLTFKQYSISALDKVTLAYAVQKRGADDVPVGLGTTWIESPGRTAISRVEFEPGRPRLVAGTLNLWTGFAVEPGDPAGCPLFLQHVREVIANGDEEMAKYILNWLALRVQGIANRGAGPLARMIVAIVLRSAQGTGKGVFEQYVADIFGPAHALITSRGDGLTGRFNWQFADKALLCADEAFFAGAAQQHDHLKSFLTEPVFTFEQKFKDAVSLVNHCAVIMSTNKDWAVPADAADRRMCVTDVSEKRIGDVDYFNALWHEKANGGPAALMAFLLARDISEFNVTKYPRTDALIEQQIHTASRNHPTIEWLNECIEAGGFMWPSSTIGAHNATFVPWDTDKPTQMSRSVCAKMLDYWCKYRRSYQTPAGNMIGKDLAQAIGAINFRPAAAGRERLWVLPPVDIAKVRLHEYLTTGKWKTAYLIEPVEPSSPWSSE